jgi:hypothetical protein
MEGGIPQTFLHRDDFTVPFFDIVDRPAGPAIELTPFSSTDINLPRRNDPQWIARYTPVLERMNSVAQAAMNGDFPSRLHMKLLEFKELVARLNEQYRSDNFPLRRRDILGFPEVRKMGNEVYKEFGEAVHTSDPYLSYLLLFKLVNWRRIGIQDYDDTIARANGMRELSTRKSMTRKSSVGEEMKPDIELPHGKDYNQQMIDRARTLVDRTRMEQAAGGYDTGHPGPMMPAPHSSDAGTVRHFGPEGSVAPRGRGIPQHMQRGGYWHEGQNRR